MDKTQRRPTRDNQVIKLLMAALDEFGQCGKVATVRFDVCKSIVQIKPLGDTAWSADCDCGRFRDILRGI